MDAEPQALAGQLFPSVSGGTDTDTEIMCWREQIHHPQWRWVYGMLAAYGLRPMKHSVWSGRCFPNYGSRMGKLGPVWFTRCTRNG